MFVLCAQISLVCPAAPVYVGLPDNSKIIRSITPQPAADKDGGSRYVAVATGGAGLLVLSSQSNNVVHR